MSIHLNDVVALKSVAHVDSGVIAGLHGGPLLIMTVALGGILMWRWRNSSVDMWAWPSIRAGLAAAVLVVLGAWWESDITAAGQRDPDIGIAMRQFQNMCTSTEQMVINHPSRAGCLPKKMADGKTVIPPIGLRDYEKFCAVIPGDPFCQYSEIDLMKAEIIK